jgi:hypothetical protein
VPRPDDAPYRPKPQRIAHNGGVRREQVWSDGPGLSARVVMVGEGYAVLRRHRCNPFLISVDKLTQTWTRLA